MGLLDLPPELRNLIYVYWLSGLTFRRSTPILSLARKHGILGEYWLSDILVVCKFMCHDSWLVDAILKASTFHLQNATDLECLLNRFGSAALNQITHIKLGVSMNTDAMVQQLGITMPNLIAVQLVGCLSPMWRVWDYCLDGFERHPWARFIACLCVVAPGCTPGSCETLLEKALAGKIELLVDFKYDDQNFKTRKMRFTTKDWLLRYTHQGKEYILPQIRPEDLEAALDQLKIA